MNFRPTDEQAAIIEGACKGNDLIVDACAGSGKTTTLKQAAEAMASTRILYLVYNRAAADDAKAVFPPNVEVRTTHSLAWAAYQDIYGDRILGPKDPRRRGQRKGAPRVPSSETAKLLGINEPLQLGENKIIQPVTLARMAVETVDRFAYTADIKVQDKHVPPMPPGLEPAQEDYLRTTVCSWAKKLWKETLKPASQHRFTFDFAFKLYALGSASLDYDVVMLDEAQDSNGITEHFIKNQDAQTIIVGDRCQALYGWRGATEIMSRFEGSRLQLTQSWRFGQEIADEANRWLPFADAPYRVRGNPFLDSRVGEGDILFPDAVLCRTSAAAMGSVIDYLDQGKRVAVVGGTKALVDLAYAASDLMAGRTTTHPELVAFSTWGELMAYTEEPGGGDLKALVGLINQYKVPGIVAACKSIVSETQPKYGPEKWSWKPPEIIVSTVHKSKGREWDTVRIADDFKEPEDKEDPATGKVIPGVISRPDAMLHYVAVTRAKTHLDRGGLAWIDEYTETPVGAAL